MATTTLSVRVTEATRRALEKTAEQSGGGPSSLAAQILAHWAAKETSEERRRSVQKLVSYLRSHPDGWDDEPSDFFPEAKG